MIALKYVDNVLNNRGFADLNPILCGAQECEPNHNWGPYMRRYFLLHYVRRGCGVYECPRGVFKVRAGEFFLIYPGEITRYVADAEQPWDYIWIGFDGALSERLNELPSPIGKLPPELFAELYTAITNNFSHWGGAREEFIASVLHRIYAELVSASPDTTNYIDQAEAYIHAMYMEDITIEQIADGLSLNRRYLSRLFKKKHGVTMKEFLTRVRMEQAQHLLSEGYSVAESGALCGYPDPANFSKMFKAYCGAAPAAFRKKGVKPPRGL